MVDSYPVGIQRTFCSQEIPGERGFLVLFVNIWGQGSHLNFTFNWGEGSHSKSQFGQNLYHLFSCSSFVYGAFYFPPIVLVFPFI